MTYFVLTKSKGKCGCSSTRWNKVEAETKTAVRKKFSSGYYGTIKGIYTETQIREEWNENTAEKIINGRA